MMEKLKTVCATSISSLCSNDYETVHLLLPPQTMAQANGMSSLEALIQAAQYIEENGHDGVCVCVCVCVWWFLISLAW